MARSGAEEIMVLLPETGPDNAQIALERLREEVAKKPVQWQDQSLDVSVCIGMLSVIEGECPTVPELLKRLDESLTIAQRVGHNQIFCETLVMENAEDGNVAE
jgi:diguanylate cyclase (GGDEF)-like protein